MTHAISTGATRGGRRRFTFRRRKRRRRATGEGGGREGGFDRPAGRSADGPLTRDVDFPGERPRLSRRLQRRAISLPLPPAPLVAGNEYRGAPGSARARRSRSMSPLPTQRQRSPIIYSRLPLSRRIVESDSRYRAISIAAGYRSNLRLMSLRPAPRFRAMLATILSTASLVRRQRFTAGGDDAGGRRGEGRAKRKVGRGATRYIIYR